MGSNESKLEAVSVVQDDRLQIDARMDQKKNVYKCESTTVGLLAVVRRAPAWFLGSKREWSVDLNGQAWTVELSAQNKTHANLAEHKLHIDTNSPPLPSFIECGSACYLELAKFQELIAQVNARLPTWKAQLSNQQLNKAQFRGQPLDRCADAPLRIMSRPRANDIKTKLLSVPDWLFDMGTVMFIVQGESWRCSVNSDMRTHINALDKHLVINSRNAPGYTRLSVEQIDHICAEFNAQSNELKVQALALRAQRVQFRETQLQRGVDAPFKIVSRPRQHHLKTKLASAPDWLWKTPAHTVRLQVGDKRWRIVVDGSKRMHIDVKTHTVILDPKNVAGYSLEISVQEIATICDAFNAQGPALCTSMQIFDQELKVYKAVDWHRHDPAQDPDAFRVVMLQKTKLHVKVAQAPRWLIESGKTFLFLFEDDVWECEPGSASPFIDADQRIVRLGSAPIKTMLDRPRVELLMAALTTSVPSWKRALDQERSSAKRLRVEAFHQFGPIKRKSD